LISLRMTMRDALPAWFCTAPPSTSTTMPRPRSSRPRASPSSSSTVACESSKRTPFTMIEPKPEILPVEKDCGAASPPSSSLPPPPPPPQAASTISAAVARAVRAVLGVWIFDMTVPFGG